MDLKRTLIATAITTAVGTPNIASADTIITNFSGVFTLLSPTGLINVNVDAGGRTDGQGNTYTVGSRTPISGTMQYDTVAGAASGQINAFSFKAGGFMTFPNLSFQSIGDGAGGPGDLMAAAMSMDWNGNVGVPVTAIFDAAGFFDSIQPVGNSWTVASGCAACATSTTPDTVLGATVGATPFAMTTFNTAGTTLGSLFPLTTDGIAGSPMTTGIFQTLNVAFDFTNINASSITSVPVPAAAWLFGSGLMGLAGIARRRRKKNI